MKKLKIISAPVFNLGDYTVFLDRGPKVRSRAGDKTPTKYSWHRQVRIEEVVEGIDGLKKVLTGRGAICRCFRDAHRSLTVRKEQFSYSNDALSQRIRPPKYDLQATDPRKDPECGYKPRSDSKALIEAPNLCDRLFEVLFPTSAGIPQGLLVISGATRSMKSVSARGLMFKYLTERAPRTDRRPHLVTYEDPIEAWFTKTPQEAVSQFGVDYTPRERGVDVAELEQALFIDALRQTPAVFYIGEVRRVEDWKHIVEFARTGHLVVTTTHANSLVGTMERIFSAVHANTPVRRGEIAKSLLGVVHQRQIKFGSEVAVVPSVWRQTPTGIAQLVSDGLSSVLPNRPRNSSGSCASFGYAWFADRLLDYSTHAGALKPRNDLLRDAINADLTGR